MPDQPAIDLSVAHRYFSGACFNQAWDLIDKPSRTAEEDALMLHLGMASIYHWSQRPDCTPTNQSVGYWQVSRIYALLRQAENAARYGQMSLQAIEGQDAPPFYLGYACEALARAAMVACDRATMDVHLARAREAAARIPEEEDRKLLLDDLKTIVL